MGAGSDCFLLEQNAGHAFLLNRFLKNAVILAKNALILAMNLWNPDICLVIS